MNFRVLTCVREEIVSAAMWFEVKAAGLGIEFLDLVEAELGKIEADPNSFPAWEHNFLDAEIRRAIRVGMPLPAAVAFSAGADNA